MSSYDSFLHRQQYIYERDPKPVLYGPKGEPLGRYKQIGFDPKRVERKDNDKISR